MTDQHGPMIDRVRAELASEPSIREVKMFGSLAFMLNEQMLVAVGRDNSLLVRINPERNRELLARPGTKPAEMGAGRPMGPSWIHVTPDAVAADDDLSFWLDAARERNAHARDTTS